MLAHLLQFCFLNPIARNRYSDELRSWTFRNVYRFEFPAHSALQRTRNPQGGIRVWPQPQGESLNSQHPDIATWAAFWELIQFVLTADFLHAQLDCLLIPGADRA
jgi:hypothetical protein